MRAVAIHNVQPEGEDDAALMERIALGDREAFRSIVQRYTGLLFAAARRFQGGGSADAEDITQETLLRVWQKAGTWRPDGGASVRTWIYRIAWNLAADQYRRRVTERKHAEAPDEEDRSTPETVMQDDQRSGVVAKALADLPERQRSALVLCHYQGLSNAEAAAVLGTSVKGVEGLLVRARRTLADELKDYRGLI